MSWDDDDDFTSVLVPITVTPAVIHAMTANGVALAEDTNPAWSSATTYAAGARVHSATTHRVYESLKDSNLNKDPTLAVNQTTAAGVGTWWLDIGPTNKFAMFDGLINTQTAAASPLVLTLRPGAFNGFAMFGLDADTISVEVLDAPGGNVIYTTGGDVVLEGSMPADYYEYFFSGFKPLTEYVVTGIQPYGNPEITITLKKSVGSVLLGMFAIGDARPLGVPERGASVEPRTYSYFAEDAYGNTKIVKRPSAMGLNIPIKVAYEDADSVLQTIQDLLDVPVAVIGSNAQFHTKLSTFGLVSGRLEYAPYPDRTLHLNVKGFT